MCPHTFVYVFLNACIVIYAIIIACIFFDVFYVKQHAIVVTVLKTRKNEFALFSVQNSSIFSRFYTILVSVYTVYKQWKQSLRYPILTSEHHWLDSAAHWD